MEDAPGLEATLHRTFNERRLNAVNRRKEFFRVSLDEIRVAVEQIVGEEVEFRVTAKAEEYRESRRFHAQA